MLLLLFSKTVRRILAALVLLPIVVFGATAARVWWVARQDDRPRSDAIVVRGAAQFDGRPAAVLRARRDHPAELKSFQKTLKDMTKMLAAQRIRLERLFMADRTWPVDDWRKRYKEGVAPRIVTVGGGRSGDRFTEAEAGKRYLATEGVTSVVAVGVGSDTLQSLKGLAKVYGERGWKSAVLVTDPWHCLRSRRMAQDLGLKAATSPVRSGPAVASRATEVRYVARESAASIR